ncbi:hypothetical protein ACNTMW_02645 [Planosporangium sp. 12N6]|uniref:hypothetical protein n=1 Tax=Planosporangium spinosum TaxID=3402278 RepID=UPI003CED2C1B
MTFAVLLIVLTTVAAVVSAAGAVARHRTRDAAGPRPAQLRAGLGTVARTDPHGERAESVLTTSLLTGRLSADEYRDEMAVLAARDARRHPLVAPPDR